MQLLRATSRFIYNDFCGNQRCFHLRMRLLLCALGVRAVGSTIKGAKVQIVVTCALHFYCDDLGICGSDAYARVYACFESYARREVEWCANCGFTVCLSFFRNALSVCLAIVLCLFYLLFIPFVFVPPPVVAAVRVALNILTLVCAPAMR